MTRYLLDTNAASQLLRRSSPSLNYRVSLISPDDYALSCISEAEMRFGVELLPSNAKTRPLVEAFLEDVTILPWDSACAKSYAVLVAKQRASGKTVSIPDAMIAAHAIAHDFTLVSNNHVFAFVEDLKLQDWTKGPQRA